MSSKGIAITLGILALIALVVLVRSFGGSDEATQDRVENYNAPMEETMRATGRRAEIEEELAEERAAAEAARQSGAQ